MLAVKCVAGLGIVGYVIFSFVADVRCVHSSEQSDEVVVRWDEFLKWYRREVGWLTDVLQFVLVAVLSIIAIVLLLVLLWATIYAVYWLVSALTTIVFGTLFAMRRY